MLHRLAIRNYAIIDKLEIEFCDRMNIITGETGAGKSILLGALSLILGDRADTKVLYNQEEKCVVEADFEIENKDLKTFFARNELDFDTHTIIRREINQSGKSRAFINDTPVTLNVLKELGEKLVNLHSQHETLELTRAGFQLEVIDVLAGNRPLLAEFKTIFSAYKKDFKRLEEMVVQQRQVASELDYLQFQFTELAEADLLTDEQLALEAEQNTLSNVEEIKRALQASVLLLTEDEVSVLDRLTEAQNQLKGVKTLNQDILTLSERLHSTYLELKDMAQELEKIQEHAALDPERLEEVNLRLTVIYRLQKKHNVTTVAELLHIQQTLQDKIALVDKGTENIKALQAQIEKQFKQLLQMADHLHAAREKVLREFQNNLVVLLTKVGMPNASFKVDMQKQQPHLLHENGLSEIRFLFSANKGFALHDLKDVASGGELSRVMLCIKSLIADAGAMPTLIFDEIDAGISGEVALKVGEIMKQLSRHHQLVAITHLPQIARTGDRHLYIYKETRDQRTHTRIRTLTGEERVLEIAKMLSGDKVSHASLANARELISS